VGSRKKEKEMKKALVLLATLVCLGSCVRMPDNYAELLDTRAETNEVMLKKIEEEQDKDKQINYLKIIVVEDIKTLRAAAETIRQGGGD
jgi:hypothetical protein